MTIQSARPSRHHLRTLVWGAIALCCASTAHAEGSEVKIKGGFADGKLTMYFEPQTLTVPAGTTVTWVNEDGSNHTVQFPDQSGPRMRHHSTYTRTFAQPGTYPYQCAIHGAAMTGTIVVQ